MWSIYNWVIVLFRRMSRPCKVGQRGAQAPRRSSRQNVQTGLNVFQGTEHRQCPNVWARVLG